LQRGSSAIQEPCSRDDRRGVLPLQAEGIFEPELKNSFSPAPGLWPVVLSSMMMYQVVLNASARNWNAMLLVASVFLNGERCQRFPPERLSMLNRLNKGNTPLNPWLSTEMSMRVYRTNVFVDPRTITEGENVCAVVEGARD
jgi:hypothetical protein